MILFTTFPILFIFAHNIDKVPIDELLIVLVPSILFAAAAWFCLKLVIKNSRKSGIIVSFFLILFFSYGHLFYALDGVKIGEFDTDRLSHFGVPFAILFVIGAYIILKTKRKLDNATFIGNCVALTLVAITFMNMGIGASNFSIIDYDTSSFDISNNISNDIQNNSSLHPNIYYIILDGYASSETLQRVYEFDNSNFTNYLKSNDFTIPEHTHANYPETHRAVSSSLNMQYRNYQPDSNNDSSHSKNIDSTYRESRNLIQHNVVMKELKSKGYETFSFDSGYTITNSIKESDYRLCPTTYKNSPFLGMVGKTTMLLPLFVSNHNGDIRKLTLCVFDMLPKINEQTTKPFFVFVHLVNPHPPYLFDKNGEIPSNLDYPTKTTNWYDRDGYLGQVQFLNKKLRVVIDEILSTDKSSIIIIQADHGPRGIGYWVNPDENKIKTLFGIINVYHFPNGCDDAIYDTITPINTFRVLFNCYFNDNYELLHDSAYLSGGDNPDVWNDEIDDFSNVTYILQK